ncbi:DUF6221 family protein [Streptomyces albidoflavus]|uniref:DUF6221 family protein n=1 Tax=Streptomyces albidoflavus TaxID=1886 RepID=UPI000775F84F|nr:DUF6221 family protein [Streptomyces albidoflavus]AMM12338.1 hypothetical protein Salbus254_5910 [Streptomyces albidoflavus]
MTADLIAFLRARLDEDEAVARAATAGPWVESGVGDHGWGVSFSAPGSGVEADDSSQGRADAAHIARHDPARVLAEVEAKRQIVERYAWLCEHGDTGGAWVLPLLALPYADHPDYRDAWRP